MEIMGGEICTVKQFRRSFSNNRLQIEFLKKIKAATVEFKDTRFLGFGSEKSGIGSG